MVKCYLYYIILERCLKNHYIKFYVNFGGDQTPQAKMAIFNTSPTVKLKLDRLPHRKINTHISSILWCLCLACMLVPCHIINIKLWFVLIGQNLFWLKSSCIFKDSIPSSHIVCQGESPWWHYQQNPLVQAIMILY